MPKLVKVNWFKEKKNLCEIYQSTGMIFSFANYNKEKGVTACHQWVKCRDFLHDAVRAQLTNKVQEIYGFCFDPAKNPALDLKKTRMLVSKLNFKGDADGQKFITKMKHGLSLLNHFEKHAGVGLSTLHIADPTGSGKQTVVMFSGPPMWMTSPFLVSMYSFLIRLGNKELEFTTEKELMDKFDAATSGVHEMDRDSEYLSSCKKALHKVIANRGTLFKYKDGFHDLYFSDTQIGDFHNRSGVVSLATSRTINEKLNKEVKEMLDNAS